MQSRTWLVVVIHIFCCLYVAAADHAMASKIDSLYKVALEKHHNMEPSEAMDDLFHILELSDGSRDSDRIRSRACLTIGNIYLGYGDNVNAAKYYEAGFNICHLPDDSLKFAYNLSLAYCLLGDEVKSRSFHRLISDCHPADRALQQYDSIVSRAYIEKTFGSASENMRLCRRALALIDSLKMDPLLYAGTPLSEMVEHYSLTGEPDSCAKWLTRYEEVALKTHYPQMIADVQRHYMEHYIRIGDKERALDYSRRYLESMDSLVDYSRFIRISAKNERAREKKLQAAADAQIRKLEFTVSLQKLIIIIVGILIAVGIAVWLTAFRFREATRQLFARNRELAVKESPAKPAGEWGELMESIRRHVSDPTNFTNPDFSIQMLADFCGSNVKYVSQAINETTGDNFRSLINGYRIREARSRLTNNPEFASLTIQSVGESVGFRSASNFVVAFKKVTGMTPSLYQKMSKSENP